MVRPTFLGTDYCGQRQSRVPMREAVHASHASLGPPLCHERGSPHSSLSTLLCTMVVMRLRFELKW